MDSFFNVVVFNVWDGPEIARVLPQRIARILTRLFTLKVFSSGVLLGDPDCVNAATCA
jgi:hypothetical protein